MDLQLENSFVHSEDVEMVEAEEILEVVKPVKPPKPKRIYRKRPETTDEKILGQFRFDGLALEEVQMFKQALITLKNDGDELTKDVVWAHYPNNILL